MNSKNRWATRWVARVAAMIMVTGALVAVQLAGAAPASAVTGLHKVTSPISVIDSQPSKTARAFCPAGEHIIGGGGQVRETGALTRRLTLTQLQPIRLLDGSRDGYVVTGAETTPGITGNWWVQAYALCAPVNSLSGYQIISAATDPSSRAVQATAAVCPAEQRAIGTGGRISNPSGQVALQVARASGSGDIARVQAHEDSDGYGGIWSVVSYAVCVNPPSGYEVVYGESVERLSESDKDAIAVCPGNKRVHGAGAAISNVAPGNVSLQVVEPFDDLKRVKAVAVENTPTSQNWDFIVAQAICAF